jgi:undecaprenyl-diphosphatase
MVTAQRRTVGSDNAPVPAHNAPVPVLEARAGSRAERFADLFGGAHPAAVFAAALVCGYVALAAASILLALFVTDVLVKVGGIGSADESAIASIVADRTPFLTDASSVGSAVGGAPVLPILVALIAIVCAILRRWRVAAFAVFVLVVESATYRVTSLIVPRDRPHVHRLEDLPANASYPSGHTAASIAVYAGLVLLLTSAITDRRLRIVAWIAAIVLPLFVAFSRMYRGMHHPLDVAGGALVGIGAVLVLLFACRAAEAAVRVRADARERTGGAVDRRSRVQAAS